MNSDYTCVYFSGNLTIVEYSLREIYREYVENATQLKDGLEQALVLIDWAIGNFSMAVKYLRVSEMTSEFSAVAGAFQIAYEGTPAYYVAAGFSIGFSAASFLFGYEASGYIRNACQLVNKLETEFGISTGVDCKSIMELSDTSFWMSAASLGLSVASSVVGLLPVSKIIQIAVSVASIASNLASAYVSHMEYDLCCNAISTLDKKKREITVMISSLDAEVRRLRGVICSMDILIIY